VRADFVAKFHKQLKKQESALFRLNENTCSTLTLRRLARKNDFIAIYKDERAWQATSANIGSSTLLENILASLIGALSRSTDRTTHSKHSRPISH